MVTTVKSITSTQEDRLVECDDNSESKAPISQDNKDVGNKRNSSTTCSSGGNRVATSSISQLMSTEVPSNNPSQRDPGDASADPKSNDISDKLLEKSSPEEPALKKQKLCQPLPENIQNDAKYIVPSSTTLSKVPNQVKTSAIPLSTSSTSNTLVQPSVTGIKDTETLQQVEPDNKQFDGIHCSTSFKPSTNQTASAVRSSNSEAKGRLSPTMPKPSSTDEKEVSKFAKDRQISSDLSSNVIATENIVTDLPMDHSTKQNTSDSSSVKTDGIDGSPKASMSIQSPTTHQSAGSERTGVSGLEITSKECEDGVGNKTTGSSKYIIAESTDKCKAGNESMMVGPKSAETANSGDKCPLEKHEREENATTDNRVLPEEVGGRNVPSAENPIKVTRSGVEDTSLGTNKCMTECTNEVVSNKEPENLIDVTKQETCRMLNEGLSKTAEAPKKITEVSIESAVKEEKCWKITETSKKSIAQIDDTNQVIPKAVDKNVITHTAN